MLLLNIFLFYFTTIAAFYIIFLYTVPVLGTPGTSAPVNLS